MELIEPELNGLLFDLNEGSPKIAQAIVRLYRVRTWTQMSHRARERVQINTRGIVSQKCPRRILTRKNHTL